MIVRTAANGVTVDAPGITPDSSESILYLPVPALADAQYLDYLVHELPLADVRAADRVVLRLHPRTADALFGSNAHVIDELQHRTAGLPTALLCWRDSGYALFVTGTRSWTQDPELVRQLANSELWALLQQPGCILAPTPEFHYEGPNGSHFGGFVRPGLALLTTDALDAVSFWLAEHIQPDMPIIADTGHLLGLCSHAQRYAQVLKGGTMRLGTSDAVRGYAENEEQFARRFEQLKEHSESSDALILISAKSSGRLERRIVDVASRFWTNVRVVNLYGIRDSGGTIICSLPPEYQRLGPRPCEMCKQGIPTVRVDPHTYLLEMSAAAQLTKVNIDDARAARLFMERYRGREVVAVHRTSRDPNEPSRHHAIHVDILRMLDVPEFDADLRDGVASIAGRIDVVLSPSHQAAVALATRVNAMCGAKLIECDEERLERLDSAQKQMLAGAKGILLVDDVVTSGARLRGYIKRLRALDGFNSEVPIHLLVALARPRSEARLKLISDMLRPGEMLHVEKVILPDWGEHDCPWCQEYAVLSKLVLTGSSYFAERCRALRQDGGFSGEAFARFDRGTTPIALSPSPVFGEGLTQAEVFFVAASAIQQLRCGKRLAECAQPPLARVLDPDGYLTGRYFESIIKAAILRACRRSDLRTSTLEPTLIDIVGTLITEPISRDFRGELVINIATGKLPQAPAVAAAMQEAASEEAAIWAQLTGG
ncbi:MAG: phosphoribosyltransferase [Gemmatimonadaceae bacterium]